MCILFTWPRRLYPDKDIKSDANAQLANYSHLLYKSNMQVGIIQNHHLPP